MCPTQVILTNTVIFLWSLSMLFQNPQDLAGRMSNTITLFLASVAFLFSVNDKLPKVRQPFSHTIPPRQGHS